MVTVLLSSAPRAPTHRLRLVTGARRSGGVLDGVEAGRDRLRLDADDRRRSDANGLKLAGRDTTADGDRADVQPLCRFADRQ
jgi:hypothetical protein